VIFDSARTVVGWISDPWHHAARLGQMRKWRADVILKAPESHFLAITADVAPNLRLMTLATAAGLYLLLEQPSSQTGE
jgi:hypothetical protein